MLTPERRDADKRPGGGPRGDRTHNPRIKRTNELKAVLTCTDVHLGAERTRHNPLLFVE